MDTFLIFGILIIAYLYSSVGHGGATGYLALMSIFSIAPLEMRGSALILNIFVSGIAFLHFARRGYFRLNLFLPFAVASVPMAYAGGRLNINETFYHTLLAICLFIAAIWIIFRKQIEIKKRVRYSVLISLIAGGIIGLVSGIVGIGGGILLSPLIFIMRWADMKETATVSALFIFVNSISGLFGLSLAAEFQINPQLLLWIAAALAGSMLGGISGSIKFKPAFLKNVLALILIFAGTKLLFY